MIIVVNIIIDKIPFGRVSDKRKQPFSLPHSGRQPLIMPITWLYLLVNTTYIIIHYENIHYIQYFS